MSFPSCYDYLHLPWHGFVEGFQVSGSDAVPDPRLDFSELNGAKKKFVSKISNEGFSGKYYPIWMKFLPVVVYDNIYYH